MVTQSGSSGAGIQIQLCEVPELTTLILQSVLLQAPVLCTHGEPPPLPGGTCLHKRVTHNSPFLLLPGPHLLEPVLGPLHELLLLPEIHSPLGLPHPLGVSSNVTSSEKPS